jgi:hypothetical protein
MEDSDYLKLVRKLPCVCCSSNPPSQAVRIKPDDWRVLPLCQWCSQHKIGGIGIDPLEFANKLYEHRDDIVTMERIVLSSIVVWVF